MIDWLISRSKLYVFRDFRTLCESMIGWSISARMRDVMGAGIAREAGRLELNAGFAAAS